MPLHPLAGQPAPRDPPECARAVLESLALKYRFVLESLENLTGRTYREVRVVGAGPGTKCSTSSPPRPPEGLSSPAPSRLQR